MGMLQLGRVPCRLLIRLKRCCLQVWLCGHARPCSRHHTAGCQVSSPCLLHVALLYARPRPDLSPPLQSWPGPAVLQRAGGALPVPASVNQQHPGPVPHLHRQQTRLLARPADAAHPG